MWNARSCSLPEQTSKPGGGGEAEAGLDLCRMAGQGAQLGMSPQVSEDRVVD